MRFIRFFVKEAPEMGASFVVEKIAYSASENSSFPTPQSGQAKSDGKSSHAVPGAIPASSIPTAGLYSQPHTSHTYFFILFNFVKLISIFLLLVAFLY